ncbi:hypothetical protein VIGAN_06076900 [Vigna angularis var. angularis]|uniref:Uncharacterized protein n=1 Tax=Vigna angularis var. angularis TaxID=157739 RepID=A0A0S3SA43_PHAAN|nr:hypothetical protein VIGAN_06076900 [Vigna angularis var. angularis]
MIERKEMAHSWLGFPFWKEETYKLKRRNEYTHSVTFFREWDIPLLVTELLATHARSFWFGTFGCERFCWETPLSWLELSADINWLESKEWSRCHGYWKRRVLVEF